MAQRNNPSDGDLPSDKEPKPRRRAPSPGLERRSPNDMSRQRRNTAPAMTPGRAVVSHNDSKVVEPKALSVDRLDTTNEEGEALSTVQKDLLHGMAKQKVGAEKERASQRMNQMRRRTAAEKEKDEEEAIFQDHGEDVSSFAEELSVTRANASADSARASANYKRHKTDDGDSKPKAAPKGRRRRSEGAYSDEQCTDERTPSSNQYQGDTSTNVSQSAAFCRPLDSSFCPYYHEQVTGRRQRAENAPRSLCGAWTGGATMPDTSPQEADRSFSSLQHDDPITPAMFEAEAHVVEDDRTVWRERYEQLQERYDRLEQVRPVLAQAQVVEGVESGQAAAQATSTEVNERDSVSREQDDNRKKCTVMQSKRNLCYIAIAVLAVVLAIGLGVGLSGSNNSGSDATQSGVGSAPPTPFSPTIRPSASPTETQTPNQTEPSPTPPPTPQLSPMPPPTLLKELIVSVSLDAGASLQDELSPQSQALSWLAGNTLLDSYSDQQKIERYAMAVFYYSTNGTEWLLQRGWLSNDDLCSWYRYDDCASSIPCNAGQSIRCVSLWANGLKGSIPQELALLSNSLEQVGLGRNQISGSIPSEIGLLSSLNYLSLRENALSGTIPDTFQSMSNMRELYLYDNDFTGEFECPSFIDQGDFPLHSPFGIVTKSGATKHQIQTNLRHWFRVLESIGRDPKTEDMKHDVNSEYRKVLSFLGLPDHELAVTKDRVVSNYTQPMNTTSRKMLEDFYAPHNKHLYKLLGGDWNGYWDHRDKTIRS